MRPLAVYMYSFGSQSCATRLFLAGSAPLPAAKQATYGASGRVRRHGLRHFFGLVVSHPLARLDLPPHLLADHPAMLRRRNTSSSPRGRSAANATHLSRRPRSTSLLALEAASPLNLLLRHCSAVLLASVRRSARTTARLAELGKSLMRMPGEGLSAELSDTRRRGARTAPTGASKARRRYPADKALRRRRRMQGAGAAARGAGARPRPRDGRRTPTEVQTRLVSPPQAGRSDSG